MKNINDFNMDFFSLKGKNAIVTGGVSGLGHLQKQAQIFLYLQQ